MSDLFGLEAYNDEEDKNKYSNSTYEIISRIAYLIGIQKNIFENAYEPPKIEVYQRFEQDKNARIIRNLCMIRTAIESNYKKINDSMRYSLKSILTLPEYVPMESIKSLINDGIILSRKPGTTLVQYIIELNGHISNRINNCKSLFPLWLDWKYIKELFIMPNGLSEEGTKAAASIYYDNKRKYPYQVYINWEPQDEGNILFNDKKFVTLLYQWHNDYFTDTSKISDIANVVKNSIYDFIDEGKKVMLLVDCENSDPYRLCATLKNLDQDITGKISSILLFDDVNTTPAWKILEKYTDIPVQHLLVERIKQDKSLVDMKLLARAFQEFYENHVDSFILASSDSDYWALINSLEKARFLVMIEREKSGPDIRNALQNRGVFYCYIEDFYSGNADEIKKSTLLGEIRRSLNEAISLNAKSLLESALKATRVTMTPAEKQRYYDKHIRPMQLCIAADGTVSVEIKI